jgi:APA family basic amino acid/polyamine antiporter
MPLKRALNLPLVTFYGLGSIIGAGIYALIGSVVKEANIFSTFSFLIAALIALFTAASYSELSARFPESAGSSLYIKKAFNRSWLSGLVGWLVVLTGIVSCGALVHGLINYIQIYLPISLTILIPIIVIILGSITIWGITESAITIFIMTLLEILGLVIIIWYGRNNLIIGIKNINQFLF